jgi:hypothetical protein
MTVTVRIQYKGEGARKLAADENGNNMRYVDDMTRALSMFSIPTPPDNSRAIWKSGFVLCNYNTSRDTVSTAAVYLYVAFNVCAYSLCLTRFIAVLIAHKALHAVQL